MTIALCTWARDSRERVARRNRPRTLPNGRKGATAQEVKRSNNRLDLDRAFSYLSRATRTFRSLCSCLQADRDLSRSN